MAISSTMVWEIRSSATASAANGGGFNPSNGASNTTDYSQQDAAQYAFSDLASTSASGWLVVTSASHNFDSNDVGNIIHISSGTNFTAGWYEIISAAANAATLDRACGSTANASSGVWKEGGALSFDGSTTVTALNNAVGGNTIWMKSGSYTNNSQFNPTPTASFASPIVWKGYNSSRGDNPTGSNRPQITMNTGGANAFVVPTSGFWDISHISLTGAATTAMLTIANTKLVNCKVTNSTTSTAKAAVNMGSATGNLILNCEIISYRGNGITTPNANTFIHGNYIHDCDIGISSPITTPSYAITNNLITTCVTAAIKLTAAATGGGIISGNTLYGAENKTGTGILFTTGTTAVKIFNNIIYGFATGINHPDTNTGCYSDYNSINNCTTARTNCAAGANDVTTAPGFTSVAQLTGTTATTSGSVLTDSGANFSSVTDNRDFCYIVSGTGVTVGQYLITGHTSTTLTLDIAPGTNATADKVYQVTTGRNFAIGANLQALAFPGAFQAGVTTGYLDIGAVQRRIDVPAQADVRSGTTYDNSLKTGTLAVPAASNVLSGVSVDATTGTYVTVATGNVRSGTTYGAASALTGTAVIPARADVRLGTNVDASTGLLDLPDVANVVAGITFDSGTKTGTYALSASTIAAAVWNEATSSHTTAGTFGVLIKKLLTTAKFLGLK